MQRPPLNSAVEESVLQLAPYLEHLEENIYIGGFKNLIVEQYTAAGFPPRFRENVGVIAEVSSLSNELDPAQIADSILSTRLPTSSPSALSRRCRLYPSTTLHLQVALHGPQVFRRPGQHNHLRRHRRFPRRNLQAHG